MKISWKYLNQLIDLKNINILDITEKLSLAGFEVENTFYDKAILDTFFDINITANRQDITGFIHIAIELSAILKETLTIQEQDEKISMEKLIYIIKDISIPKKENNLLRHLRYFNIQITETILDEINFINLKWGQEIKAYELQIAQTDSIKTSCSNIHININSKDEVYYNHNRLSELNTTCTSYQANLKNIALINHKILNIYSKYAYKDILKTLNITKKQFFITNILRAKKLTNQNDQTIVCQIDTIKQIFGPIKANHTIPPFNTENTIETLKKLKFNVDHINDKLNIKIPRERLCYISDEINIIEEIGRIYGFNNFIDQLPSFHNIHLRNSILQLNKKIRRILRSNGLHEIINYSFQRKKDNKKYSIINPLNQELSVLRHNLLENLLTSKIHNIYQNNDFFEVFEIGHIFIENSLNKRYEETQHLACLIGNISFNQLTWQNKKSALTWSQAKGQIEELLEKLNTQTSWSVQKAGNSFLDGLSKYIHPKRSLYINDQGHSIGILSQLNYRINNLISPNNRLYFFEIDLIKLSRTITVHNHLKYRYIPYPNYPKVTRDISIKVNQAILMQQIFYFMSLIHKNRKDTIESIKILNEYYSNNYDRTICLRISYRSLNRTLTSAEIEILNNSFKQELLKMIESKA